MTHRGVVLERDREEEMEGEECGEGEGEGEGMVGGVVGRWYKCMSYTLPSVKIYNGCIKIVMFGIMEGSEMDKAYTIVILG